MRRPPSEKKMKDIFSLPFPCQPLTILKRGRVLFGFFFFSFVWMREDELEREQVMLFNISEGEINCLRNIKKNVILVKGVAGKIIIGGPPSQVQNK